MLEITHWFTPATSFLTSSFHLFFYFFWGILCHHKGFFERQHICNCPQCQVQVQVYTQLSYKCICIYLCLSCLPLSLYNTRSDETGGVPRLGSGMIGPTSLLHSRHWVLFSSIFFLSFKSNYHSDQWPHKILGKLSCLHLTLYPSLSSLIAILTNYHSDQLPL